LLTRNIFGMVGRTCPRGLLYALLLSPVLASLLLSGLIPPSTGPTVYATPSSYSWNSLRADTVSIAYSVDERAWYGGTGYLTIVTNGPSTYGDAKECVASVNIPQGVLGIVYVCGDDHNPQTPPYDNRWYVFDKYLRVYVDGVKVYELTGYWWSSCYSRAATLSPGNHTVRLLIHASVWTNRTGSDTFTIGYASMEIRLEGSGTINAESHAAEATLDGEATHIFEFRLPQVSGVRNMSWKAVWKGFEKTGCGTPGSVQKAVFKGVNRDCWVFTSLVLIRVGDSVPSVSVSEGYVINAAYDEGSGEVGIRRLAVAISNGDEVGFTSARYLVTEIKRDTRVVGGMLIGSEIWTNSGSTISFNQTISYFCSNGWVTEKIRGGVETGSATVKAFEELNISRKVSFFSKNRSDELELTTRLPKLTLVFTHIKISAERNGGSVNARAFWAHDNSPIAGLRVRCFETDQGGVTDFNGRVSFSIAGSGFQVTIHPAENRNGITAYEEARVGL